MLRTVNDASRPIMLHVVTKKGKGYAPAEEDPEKYHSAAPFEVSTGKFLREGARPTYTDVFSDTITSLAADDPRICAITAAMSKGTGLEKFRENFPERLFDVGIAEEHAITFAAGLATSGYRPVVAMYSTFLQRGFDQVLHDVALQKLPVILAVDRAGLVGRDGATHHGVFDISFLSCIPNMVILAPKDEVELRDMLHFAVRYDGPIAVRYPRGQGPGASLNVPVERLRLGEGRIERDGEKIAIFAVGPMVHEALRAAAILSERGVDPMVVNPRFVKPIDAEIIKHAASRADCFISLEEHVLNGGFGSLLSLEIDRLGLSNVKLKRIGIPDMFVEHGTTDDLREMLGLTPVQIADSCAEFVESVEASESRYD
jgi:1-deoxy-D-xylulose-5-phosphate synthase